jgi:mono/diheme cytochrome c family protein
MIKLLVAATGLAFVALSGQALAEAGPAPAHHIEIGKKVYERAFGRGCGACHDIASNPQLPKLIDAGKLDPKTFATVLKEGKNGMPKAIDQIMELAPVKTANLSEEEAINAVYDYLKSLK